LVRVGSFQKFIVDCFLLNGPVDITRTGSRVFGHEICITLALRFFGTIGEVTHGIVYPSIDIFLSVEGAPI